MLMKIKMLYGKEYIYTSSIYICMCVYIYVCTHHTDLHYN